MIISNKWQDYKVLDAGEYEKLEIWKDVILRRPDPSCIWPKNSSFNWNKVDGFYHRSNQGGGNWQFNKKLPEFWTINYGPLTFKVSPTGFKHTGIFPEQASNWDFIIEKIQNSPKQEIKVLNLFAYTGGATCAASYGGASEVVHVDAAKGMVSWAKENVELSHLEGNTIRFIVDDCLKFVQREQRRGRKYDAIIMDPPSYGRGPNGEMWKLEEQLPILLEETMKIMSDDPLFFIINTYTTGFSTVSLYNLLKLTLQKKYPNKQIVVDNLGLPIEHDNLVLPAGITGRLF